ncbi:o-succinylbenzoate synthase [Pueribacillus theae]|uniref:o-succinylbenzoate synthase n=1 Tax=Pueribacillus theae TaxID=2171751 RepID=UPI00387EC0DD
MKFHRAVLHHILMTLKTPFAASSGSTFDREFIIVELQDKDGVIGWGECSAFSSPWYTEETTKTAWHMLEDFLIPIVFENHIEHPENVSSLFRTIKRNNMAKAAIEEAVWDVYAKRNNSPLASVLGGKKRKIEVGAAVGIQQSEKELLHTVERYVNEGYKRIKVKISPGMEDKILSPIRSHFPMLPLMADANSAYTLEDLAQLKKLDQYDLLMIEQPLAADDIFGHAVLQKELNTPICLDESITSYRDAKQAIEQKSCQIINIKVSRVGGLTEAKRIHDLCKEHQLPVWCGGMLDSGIGRAHNIAISTLDHFIIPGDTSASSRYWVHDLITPEVTMVDGCIEVPEKPGIGYEVNREQLKRFTLCSKVFKNTFNVNY